MSDDGANKGQGIFSKIFSPIARVLGLGSELEVSLETRVRDVAEKERMVFDGNPLWAFIVHDYNEIHIFKDAAVSFGFENTPVYGTWIAGRAEQYVTNLLNELNNLNGRSLKYCGHTIKFKKPLYPGQLADWNLVNAIEREGGIDLVVSASDSNGKSIIQCPEIVLRPSKIEIKAEEVIPFSSEDVVARKSVEIPEHKLKAYYSCLGKSPKEDVPMMYAASFAVSSLLDISSRKAGRPEGGLAGMDLRFYNSAIPGVINTSIRMPSPPEEKFGVYHYVFEGLCTQADKPILSGKFRVFSKSKFEI